MKPYYDHGGITIYHGDCRDVLPTLSIEQTVLLTDPVYGIEGGRGGQVREHGKATYQKSGWEDTEDYVRTVCVPVVVKVMERASRGAVTPGNRCMFLYPRPDDIGCFWTPAAQGVGPWGLTCFNPILYYGKDFRAGIGPWPTGRQVVEAAPKNGHPCPKPETAWKWLAAKVSQEGETILDPFMGSGTTLVAAQSLGRRAIGIEIEEKYCRIAVDRLRQMPLPLIVPTSHDRLSISTQGGLFDGSPTNGRDQTENIRGQQGAPSIGGTAEATERNPQAVIQRREASNPVGWHQGADDMEPEGRGVHVLEGRKAN